MCMSRATRGLLRAVSRECHVLLRDIPGTAARGEKLSIVGVLHL